MSTLSTYFPTGGGGGGSGYSSDAKVTDLFALSGNNVGAADCPEVSTNYCNGYVNMIHVECKHLCIWATCPYCCCTCTQAGQFNCCFFLKVYASRACKVEKGCWCVLKENELIGCHPLFWGPYTNCVSKLKVDIFPTTDGGFVIVNEDHDPFGGEECQAHCYSWRACHTYVNQLCCCQQCVTIVNPSVTCACSGTQTALPASTYHGIFWSLIANNRMSRTKRAINADGWVCGISSQSTGQNDAKYCQKCVTRFDDTNGIDIINDRKRNFGPVKYFAAYGTNHKNGCTVCSEEGNCCRGLAMLFPDTVNFCMCACLSCFKAACCFGSTNIRILDFQNYQEYFYDSPNESALSILELPSQSGNREGNNFATYCYNGDTGCANFFLGSLPMCWCHGGECQINSRAGSFSGALCRGNPCKIAISMLSNPLCDATELSNSTTGCFHTSAITCWNQPRDIRLYMLCNCATAGTDAVVKSSCQRGCGPGTCCASIFFGSQTTGGYRAPSLSSISDIWSQSLMMVHHKGTCGVCQCSANTVKLVKFNWQNCTIHHMCGQGCTCFDTCVCLCNLPSCDTLYCGGSNNIPGLGYTGLGLGPRFPRTDHVLLCDNGTCTVVVDTAGRFQGGGGCWLSCTSGNNNFTVRAKLMKFSSNGSVATGPCVACDYCTDDVCPIGGFAGNWNLMNNGLAKFTIPNVCHLCYIGRTGASLRYCCSDTYLCCRIYTCEVAIDDYSYGGRIYGSCTKLGSNCFWLQFTGCGRAIQFQNTPRDELWFYDHRSVDCYNANICNIPLPALAPGCCAGRTCVASTVFHDQLCCCIYILRGDAETNTAGNPVYITKFCYDTTGVLGHTTFCSEDTGGKVNFYANCYDPLASANLGDSTYPYRCAGLVRCCQAAILYTKNSTVSVVEWGDT